MLAQVAAAQIQAGAPAAAVKTVARVGDDRLRAHILAGVERASRQRAQPASQSPTGPTSSRSRT